MRRIQMAVALTVTAGLLLLIPNTASAGVPGSRSQAAARSSAPFTLYKTGRGSSGIPRNIVDGPDGALWFTMGGHRPFIGRMTTSGKLKEYGSSNPLFAPGNSYAGTANNMTTGSDGAIWFVNNVDAVDKLTSCSGTFAIGRITTEGKMTFYADPSLLLPSDIVSGPDGALWFLSGGCGGVPYSLDRMTTSGVVTDRFSLASVPGQITGVTSGPDGAIWFSDIGYSQGSGADLTTTGQLIGRVTTSGSITTFPVTAGLSVPSEGPAAITVGSDGAVWFANQGDECDPEGQGTYCVTYTSIDRMTPTGAMTAYYPPQGSSFGAATGPVAMTPGLGGSVWLADYGIYPSVVQVTSSGVVTPYLITMGSRGGPTSIVTGSDGAIWFTSTNIFVVGRRISRTFSAIGRLGRS